MKIFLSLLIIAIYWSLDAYQAVLNFDISFTKAILLDYENSNSLLKLTILISIFIFFMIPTKKTEKIYIPIEKKYLKKL